MPIFGSGRCLRFGSGNGACLGPEMGAPVPNAHKESLPAHLNTDTQLLGPILAHLITVAYQVATD